MTTTITRTPRTVVVDRTQRSLNPAVRNGLTGWSTYAGASGVSTTSNPSGSGPIAGVTSYARQSWTTASTNYGDWNVGADKSQSMVALRGLAVSFSIYVRNTLAMASARLIVEFYDASDTMIGSANLGPTVNVAASAWGRLTLSGLVVPANASYAIQRARSGVAQTVGSVYDATANLIEVGAAVGSYFDGSFASVPPNSIYGWTGTANASPSTVGHYNPADVFTPLLMLGYEMDRESGNIVIDVPGSSDRVTVLHPLKNRTGSVSLLLADEAAAVALDALLSQLATFVLADDDRDIVGMTFALTPGSGALKITLDPDTRSNFLANIQVVEQ